MGSCPYGQKGTRYSSNLPPWNFLPRALKLQEQLHVSQFPMDLHPEFEPVRAALMNREIPPNLDTCVQDVLREETHL